MYAMLSLVFLFDSLKPLSRLPMREKASRLWILIGFAVGALYGGLIEILQENFFYPRTGTWGDWLADIAGCAVGLLLYLIIWSIEKRK